MGIPIHVIDSGNPLVGYQELKKAAGRAEGGTSSTATAPGAT